MKTVLFICLNLLETLLVLTQTRRPFPGVFPTDCKLTQDGREYAGPLSVTRYGRACQNWNSDEPHLSNFKNSTLFPEGTAVAAGNKCRNPDMYEHVGPWCYTTDPNRRWEPCKVDFCNVDCRLTNDGREYAGSLNVTRSGWTCQRWDSDYPHKSNFKDSKLYPEGSATAAGNKCRNPDMYEHRGVWCYTTDPRTRYEICQVDFCNVTSAVFQTSPQKLITLKQTTLAQTRATTRRTTPTSTMDTHFVNGANTSTDILWTVTPIVGVIAVICIVVLIMLWKRTRLFQDSLGRNPSSAERVQQVTVPLSTIPMQNDSFENPYYVAIRPTTS